jgi:hypothetical protein
VDCFDDEDYPDLSEEEEDRISEEAEEKGIVCQPEDDFCDYDEHCELTSVDCIDDTKFDEDDYDG